MVIVDVGAIVLFVVWRLRFIDAASDRIRSYLLSKHCVLRTLRCSNHLILLDKHGRLLLDLGQAMHTFVASDRHGSED